MNIHIAVEPQIRHIECRPVLHQRIFCGQLRGHQSGERRDAGGFGCIGQVGFIPPGNRKPRLIKTRFTSLGGGRIIHTPFPGQRQVVWGIVHIVLFSQFPGRIADKLLPRSSFSFRGMRRIRPGWQRRNRNRRYRSDVVNSHLGNQRGNRQQGTGKQSIAEDMFHANVCDLDRTKIHFFYQFNK